MVEGERGERGGLKKVLEVPIPVTAVVKVGGRLNWPDTACVRAVCTLHVHVCVCVCLCVCLYRISVCVCLRESCVNPVCVCAFASCACVCVNMCVHVRTHVSMSE